MPSGNYILDAMSYLMPNFAGGRQQEEEAGSRNPLAFLIANRGGSRRRGPPGADDDDDPFGDYGDDITGVGDIGNPFSGPDNVVPPNEMTPTCPGGETGEGDNLPGGGGSGRWGQFLENPANRSFMMSMGLQLMTGGWGNTMSQLAAGLGAGMSAANVQERRDAGEIVDNQGRTDRTRTGRTRNRRGRGRNTSLGGLVGEDDTGTGTGTGTGRLNPEQERRRVLLTQAEEFINSNPTPEAWNTANQPGGLIHVAFGGPREYETRNDLLHLVQDDRRRTERTTRTPPENRTTAEWLELGASPDPVDQAEFNIWARTPRSRGGGQLGSPGVGYRWTVDPTSGQITRAPLSGEGAPRTGGGRGGQGSAFALAANAGVDAARLTINNVRDWLAGSIGANDPTGISGMAQRAFGQTTGVGDYARIMGSMKDGVMSYVHSRSGAQVAVREFEHYLTTRMPVPGDSETSIRYKLADLELALMLIARRRGENITSEQLLTTYNLVRQYSGLRPVDMELFNTMLPSLENERGVRPGPNPPPGGPGPGTQPPPRTERPGQTPPTRQPPPELPPPFGRGTGNAPPNMSRPPHPGLPTEGNFEGRRMRDPDGRAWRYQNERWVEER